MTGLLKKQENQLVCYCTCNCKYSIYIIQDTLLTILELRKGSGADHVSSELGFTMSSELCI